MNEISGLTRHKYRDTKYIYETEPEADEHPQPKPLIKPLSKNTTLSNAEATNIILSYLNKKNIVGHDNKDLVSGSGKKAVKHRYTKRGKNKPRKSRSKKTLRKLSRRRRLHAW